MKNCLLSMQGVCAGYGGGDVIHNISLGLARGEILALVGASGSGKSTVIKTILGMTDSRVRLTRGTIFFDGTDMTLLSREQHRKLLGEELCMVFQNPSGSMNPIRKIRSQFLETICSHRRVQKKVALTMIGKAFDKLGLGDSGRILDSCPFELSGGMCQRAALALAMVMEPKLILADEPTSALDVMSQRQVVDELNLLRQAYGASVILVTHNIALAAQIADRTAIMENGRIVECGETVQLLAKPGHQTTKTLLSDVPKIQTVFPHRRFDSPLLEVREISKRYVVGQSTIDAVTDISFTLSPGEALGIVGQSGSGKSTLSRQILGLEKPNQGSIRFDGAEITNMDKGALRRLYRRAQMVFQTPVASFDPRQTVRATLRDAVRNLTNKKTAAADQYIDQLMLKVGLTPELAGRYPYQLSGGQCQRAAIARAICTGPQLLICDEATSALDVSTQARIVELLDSLVRQAGMGMIFISHDIALVSNLCDTIMVMKNGQCVEYGPTEKIIAAPQTRYTRALLQAATFQRFVRGTGF